MRFLTSFVLIVILFVFGAALVLSAGVFNVAATATPSAVEHYIAGVAVSRSVALRAPKHENPVKDKAAFEKGLTIYAEACAQCHGGPDVEPLDYFTTLNPPAPELDHFADHWSDGELFWIAKHGIRMTGMPAFGTIYSDEKLWQLVYFLRKADSLSAEHQQKMAEIVDSRRIGRELPPSSIDALVPDSGQD